MSELLPFDQWPDDHFQRTYQVEDALGVAFVANLKTQMQFIKKKCAVLALELPDTELEAVVREAAFGGVYALLMVLDGVADTPIDDKHGVEWAVQAKVLHHGGETQTVEVPLQSGDSVVLNPFRPSQIKFAETVEVLPGGDGLCYAYHGWKDAYNKVIY